MRAAPGDPKEGAQRPDATADLRRGSETRADENNTFNGSAPPLRSRVEGATAGTRGATPNSLQSLQQ